MADPAAGDTPQFSVVLPIHDQADHLERMAAGHLAVLERLERSHELLLVTNGCNDDSPQIAQRLAGEHGAIRALDLPHGGWGRAVQAGLREARGELLCYTNSARTTPEMLALHLAYAIAYPDVVIKANRKVRDSWRRRLGSLLYNLESRALFDLAWWDINGTPKVFPRRFSRLLELEREDDLIDLEFSAVCKAEDYPVIEVPILATVRVGGRSTTNYGSAVRMYLGALSLHRSRNRR
jgi:glycosyltransferase involved in cell wall biosynthesis